MAVNSKRSPAAQERGPGLWAMASADWVPLPRASAEAWAVVRAGHSGDRSTESLAQRIAPFRTKVSDLTLRETIR